MSPEDRSSAELAREEFDAFQVERIEKLQTRLKDAEKLILSIKLESLDDKTPSRYIEAQREWINKTVHKTHQYFKKNEELKSEVV